MGQTGNLTGSILRFFSRKKPTMQKAADNKKKSDSTIKLLLTFIFIILIISDAKSDIESNQEKKLKTLVEKNLYIYGNEDISVSLHSCRLKVIRKLPDCFSGESVFEGVTSICLHDIEELRSIQGRGSSSIVFLLKEEEKKKSARRNLKRGAGSHDEIKIYSDNREFCPSPSKVTTGELSKLCNKDIFIELDPRGVRLRFNSGGEVELLSAFKKIIEEECN